MDHIWFIIFNIGLVQGLFLMLVLLFLKNRQKTSVYLLLLLMLCFLSLIAFQWLGFIFPIEDILFSFRTGETIPLLLGPLFLGYILSIVKPQFQFDRSHLLHFLPFVFFFILFLPFYLSSDEYKIQYLESLDSNNTSFSMLIFSLFKGLHSIVYFIISWRVVKRAEKAKKARKTRSFHTTLLSWIILLQIMMIAGIYMIVLLEYFFVTLEPDRISSGLVTLSFFILTFSIIRFPASLVPEKVSPGKVDRYRASTLQAISKQQILNTLKEILEKEKLYLRSDLSLSDLAERIGVSSNQLSQVINELLDKNFQRFINEYRVQEVKENITDPSRTLLGIAMDSGFNSKSAFNRVFKDIVGQTPSQYKKSL